MPQRPTRQLAALSQQPLPGRRPGLPRRVRKLRHLLAGSLERRLRGWQQQRFEHLLLRYGRRHCGWRWHGRHVSLLRPRQVVLDERRLPVRALLRQQPLVHLHQGLHRGERLPIRLGLRDARRRRADLHEWTRPLVAALHVHGVPRGQLPRRRRPLLVELLRRPLRQWRLHAPLQLRERLPDRVELQRHAVHELPAVSVLIAAPR